MRLFILAPLCLAVAACSGGEAQNDQSQAATPASMPSGQWNTNFEVTAFRSTDNQKPAVDTKVGDKTSTGGCVTAGSPPPPELFAGDGYKCRYKNSYIKEGMINASLSCTHEHVSGEMVMTVEGSYTATGFEAKVDSTTFLPGPGDFEMSRKVSGSFAGPTCAPVDQGGEGNSSAGNGSAPAG